MKESTGADQPLSQSPNVLGGIVTLASGEILARLVAFVGTALLTRRLGPEGFGTLGFATALCGYLALAVNAGLGEVGAREVARNRHRAGALYVAVVAARLALASGALVLLVGLCVALPKPDTVRLVVLLTGLSFVSLAIDATWVYKGLERPGVAAVGQLLAQVVYVVSVGILVTTPDHVTRVPLVLFAGELVAGLLLGGSLLAWHWPTFNWNESRTLLTSAGYLSAARVARTIIITFDVVFLGFVVTSTEVGWYTASYRLGFLLMAIAGAISTAYLPQLARAATKGTDSIQSITRSALSVSLALGAPLTIGAAITARPLLRELFGVAFEPAAPAFALLALSMGFFFVHSVLSNVLLVTHDTKALARIYIAAAIFTIILDLVAIPYHGIVGAAYVSACAEGLIVAFAWARVRRLGISIELLPLVSPVIGASLMGAALWLTMAQIGLIGQIAFGGAIYTAVIGLFVAARRSSSRMRER